MNNLHNIERSAFRRGEYVGWDAQGLRYRIVRNGPRRERGSWWVYGCIPVFYAGTLALVSVRLARRESTVTTVRSISYGTLARGRSPRASNGTRQTPTKGHNTPCKARYSTRPRLSVVLTMA